MKTTEDYMRDALGYGDEAKFNMINRDHMIAVVTFSGNCPPELVKFTTEYGSVRPSSVLDDVELIPFTIYQGNFYNCVKLFTEFIKIPVD